MSTGLNLIDLPAAGICVQREAFVMLETRYALNITNQLVLPPTSLDSPEIINKIHLRSTVVAYYHDPRDFYTSPTNVSKDVDEDAEADGEDTEKDSNDNDENSDEPDDTLVDMSDDNDDEVITPRTVVMAENLTEIHMSRSTLDSSSVYRTMPTKARDKLDLGVQRFLKHLRREEHLQTMRQRIEENRVSEGGTDLAAEERDDLTISDEDKEAQALRIARITKKVENGTTIPNLSREDLTKLMADLGITVHEKFFKPGDELRVKQMHLLNA